MCHQQDLLNQYKDRKSCGHRNRFMMALALDNKPELVFLVDPSTGLDPQARRNLWEVVQKIKAGGRTIVLTTHNMEEAQALCDEIAIMDYGRIIARGSPAELIKRHCGGVTVELPATSFNPSLPPLSVPFQVVQDRIEMMTDDLNGFVAELVAKNVNLKDMAVRSPNLEDVFLTLTGRQLRE